MSKRHMLAAADEPLEFFDGEPERTYGRRPELAPKPSRTKQKGSKFTPGRARASFRPSFKSRHPGGT